MQQATTQLLRQASMADMPTSAHTSGRCVEDMPEESHPAHGMQIKPTCIPSGSLNAEANSEMPVYAKLQHSKCGAEYLQVK
jgi:hypothetical protein